MKKSILAAAAVTLLIAGSMNVTHAQTQSQNRDNESSASVRVNSSIKATNGSSTSSVRIEKSVNGNATTTVHETRGNGSNISVFVQTLLNSSDRIGGIGPEVRVIAREQASSSERMERAREKIEARARLSNIFAGSDYENIGVLRREMTSTRNRIDRLNRELEKVASSTVKAEIQTQINLLEEDQEKIRVFIQEHEDTFSLFGWLRKLFVSVE
jgi:hypothetical protein